MAQVEESDEPAYVTSTVGGATSTTWYGSSLGGDLSVTVTDGVTHVTVADLHGDVATTLTLDVSGAVTAVGAFSDYDEYGRLLTVQPNTGAVTYGWVGSHERATDDTGLLLMGVRVYNPVTGLFTSTDPVAGGGDTSYGYPTDPVNKFDLDGRMWGWVKKACKAVAKAVTKVAEVASYIPGPIGMVASGVTAVGYMAQGNYKAAAAAMVGVIPGGKMMATAAKATKALKTVVGVKKASAVVSKVNKGIYIVKYQGQRYVGMSTNITRRLNQHVAAGKFSAAAAQAAKRIPVSGGRQAMRNAEQTWINRFGGIGGGRLTNVINSVAKQHWASRGIPSP